MLRTSVQHIPTHNPNKMDYGTWEVRQQVDDFLQGLSNFQRLVIQFCHISFGKNPKIIDFKRILNTFHNQHYHKFLYDNQDRTPECRAFIQCLHEFEGIVKPTKNDYSTLLTTLQSFQQHELPGGHFHKIPFIFTDQSIGKWFYDEVLHKKTMKEIFINDTVKNGIWTGHTKCPANTLNEDSPHRLVVPLTVQQKEILSKLHQDNIQVHQDFVKYKDNDDPYKDIQLAHLHRNHHSVQTISDKYKQLTQFHHDVKQQFHESKQMLSLNKQITHRQLEEINTIRREIETKNRELLHKDHIIYQHKMYIQGLRYPQQGYPQQGYPQQQGYQQQQRYPQQRYIQTEYPQQRYTQ